jgi:hypothetical protein
MLIGGLAYRFLSGVLTTNVVEMVAAVRAVREAGEEARGGGDCHAHSGSALGLFARRIRQRAASPGARWRSKGR